MDKTKSEENNIPIWQKMNLTINEAIQYSNIGENRLRELMEEPSCPFVLYVGTTKKLVKRKEFEEWNRNSKFI